MDTHEVLWAASKYAVLSIRCSSCESSCTGASTLLVKHSDLTVPEANASPHAHVFHDGRVYRVLVNTGGENTERLLNAVKRIAEIRTKKNPITGLWARLDAAVLSGEIRPN